ncbi:SDR family oxidoreductase [Limnospira fusiformis KN01]|uniref:SDR family NAD(P)-dependent oxidoreductase n=1 Tax=Limnospira TaxID=2596745 RepID=UPI0016589C3C|nr:MULTISPECIES: SDR family oxidoreductase [Limnospira]MDT9200341.1 SDR family NAD(P)-dependent oxidoreductase [Limnospira sp. PMC 1042.18]ULB45958.1 SDR family oxidoreductase [Limnospira fusiformis KN01]
MIDLTGKVVIVTGASSGIGRQCAIDCSRLGARVALFGRDQVRLQQTLSECDYPDQHMIVGLDLCDYDKIEPGIKDCVERLGKLSGLIHSAGISTTLPLSSLKADNFEHFIATNVISSFLLAKTVTKRALFSDEGGSIVFMSSVMGVVGERGKTLYSATKGALISGARSLALELAPRKIRVNTISPGVVVTPLSERAIYNQSAESRRRIEELHPLGLGTPEDIANACAFLLSDASRWVTGSNLILDGGYSAL